uniref:Cyclic nucleotide-binding domain-containing protein n=1 Tax=Macrostomum lignano TaxID=282301 RepID=A0A1I8FCY5_9PLAT
WLDELNEATPLAEYARPPAGAAVILEPFEEACWHGNHCRGQTSQKPEAELRKPTVEARMRRLSDGCAMTWSIGSFRTPVQIQARSLLCIRESSCRLQFYRDQREALQRISQPLGCINIKGAAITLRVDEPNSFGILSEGKEFRAAASRESRVNDDLAGVRAPDASFGYGRRNFASFGGADRRVSRISILDASALMTRSAIEEEDDGYLANVTRKLSDSLRNRFRPVNVAKFLSQLTKASPQHSDQGSRLAPTSNTTVLWQFPQLQRVLHDFRAASTDAQGPRDRSVAAAVAEAAALGSVRLLAFAG